MTLAGAPAEKAVVTICSTNYLAKALVLRESFLEFHADAAFYILIVDRKSPDLAARHPEVNFLWAEELGIPGFFRRAMMFDVIELNTNVKPTVLLKLLGRHRKVLYLDPDIQVFRRLEPVFDALEENSIVVTPHTFTPVLDGCSPCDIDFSRFGSFNLGFAGVRRSEDAEAFLRWWSDRCLQFGFYEPQSGLAVDQKWVDLAPCFFHGLKVLKLPGLNMAFWNLHERQLSRTGDGWIVNGDSPLYFFHFSSFNAGDPHVIAHKQDRFQKDSRPDLHPILDDYAERLAASDGDGYGKVAYSFDFFRDGTYVTPSLRRFYVALADRFQDEDPFEVGSALYAFALQNNLAGPKHRPATRQTFKDMGNYSTATSVIRFLLRTTLRLAGPSRYFSLMRYLAYISSIRNQADLFGNAPSATRVA